MTTSVPLSKASNSSAVTMRDISPIRYPKRAHHQHLLSRSRGCRQQPPLFVRKRASRCNDKRRETNAIRSPPSRVTFGSGELCLDRRGMGSWGDYGAPPRTIMPGSPTSVGGEYMFCCPEKERKALDHFAYQRGHLPVNKNESPCPQNSRTLPSCRRSSVL
jgi:hypothetical protein